MKDCHGCGGKGWVELSHGQAVKCPVCGGAGKVNELETPPPTPTPPYPPYTYPWYPYVGDVIPDPWKVWCKTGAGKYDCPRRQTYIML